MTTCNFITSIASMIHWLTHPLKIPGVLRITSHAFIILLMSSFWVSTGIAYQAFDMPPIEKHQVQRSDAIVNNVRRSV